MPNMMVRDLSEETLRKLDQRAAARGVSREKEVRQILTDAAAEDEADAWARVERLAAISRRMAEGKPYSNSEDDLAEVRAMRGCDK
ncbi:MAG: hypothetical protein LDL26_01280 [Caenispirillum bisanense]|nr:hypothetical protein [Caenispirillum bisanense]MCA1971836.1 hypothetical protein [Caenispirillum sp.]